MLYLIYLIFALHFAAIVYDLILRMRIMNFKYDFDSGIHIFKKEFDIGDVEPISRKIMETENGRFCRISENKWVFSGKTMKNLYNFKTDTGIMLGTIERVSNKIILNIRIPLLHYFLTVPFLAFLLIITGALALQKPEFTVITTPFILISLGIVYANYSRSRKGMFDISNEIIHTLFPNFHASDYSA